MLARAAAGTIVLDRSHHRDPQPPPHQVPGAVPGHQQGVASADQRLLPHRDAPRPSRRRRSLVQLPASALRQPPPAAAAAAPPENPVDPIRYRHGCNGLILVTNLNSKKHHVWNPAIRRTLELPDPNPRALGFAFSYVPAARNFRIVSFYEDDRDESNWLCCQVLTLDVGVGAWREVELPEADKFVVKGGEVFERFSVVLSGGAVHVVQVSKDGNHRINTDVGSLDLETEKFTVSRFPDSSRKKRYWDLDWDGKLGFAEVVGENLEVVELEDYKSGRWSETKSVVRLAFKNRSNAVPLLAKKGEIWFWMKYEKIFKYSIDTGRCSGETVAPRMYFEEKTFMYKPSLISFQGMLPDTQFRPYAITLI